MKRGWYHDASMDGITSILYHGDKNKPPYDLFDWGKMQWGPFKTFSEAKKDAIDYYKTDITTARNHISDVRKIKKEPK